MWVLEGGMLVKMKVAVYETKCWLVGNAVDHGVLIMTVK